MESIKEELKNKLEELAHNDFILEMQDHWRDKEYQKSDEIHKEIKEVIEKLREMSVMVYHTTIDNQLEEGYRLGCGIIYKENNR